MTMTETDEITLKVSLTFPLVGHKCALTENGKLLPGSVTTHIRLQSEFQIFVENIKGCV